jgi:ArsR family transcriptional regulator
LANRKSELAPQVSSIHHDEEMPSLATTVDFLQLVGEPTRVRLLSLLVDRELTVADLSAATELGQSRVSTHLGRLREAGIVADRKVGTATYYSLNDDAMAPCARQVWSLVRAEVDDDILSRDRARWTALSQARDKAASWPDALAGQMERHYSPGRTWESLARGLVGLVALGDVLDAGSGDGTVAQLLAPRSESYTMVDKSERMLRAAALRLATHANVRLDRADVQDLPYANTTFDTALLFNVLTEIPKPQRALAEIARVLRPDGRLAVITIEAHDHREVAAAYRHLHQGFTPAELRRHCTRAGFDIESCEVTSRERRQPRLGVVTAFARVRDKGRKRT